MVTKTSVMTTVTMQKINERLANASVFDVDELADHVDLIYDGWEELKDGFQVFDIISLAGSIGQAYVGNKEAFAQALDLQDDEIIKLTDRSAKFELHEWADEARQLVKWILVSVQTYDRLIHEKRSSV